MPVAKQAVIEAMAGRFADFYSQFTELKPLGGELRGPCPLHGGTGPNFAVNPDTGLWNCFSGCHDGGDVFRFSEKKRGHTFPEALAEVATFAGVSDTSLPQAACQPKGNTLRPALIPELPAEPVYLDAGIAAKLHQNLMNSDKVRRWLSEHRGLTTETLTRFQIGLLPPAAKGEEWRICFPVLDRQGRFTNIRKHLFAYNPDITDDRRREMGKTKPWEAGLMAGLFPVSTLTNAAEVLIVEGEADAALACQMGFPAVTGTSGAGTWHERWTQELAGKARATILYDADPAGEKGAEKVAAALASVVPDVRIARLPDGEDFTSWVVGQGATVADVQGIVDRATEFVPAAVSSVLRQGGRSKEEIPPSQIVSWESPTLFTSHALPPFPLEALPDVLAGFVGEVAASTQVPADMPAMIALSVVAAAGARRFAIQVGETHTEPLNLYLAVVMEPGSRKSATMDALKKPMEDAQRELSLASQSDITARAEVRAVEDKRLGFLREQAAKAKDPAERETLMHELTEQATHLTEVPTTARLLADDVTPEKLAALMAEQGGTMALLSAEGGIFGILAGRYSDGNANLDLFLKGHAGESVRVDRQGRPSVHIERACLTMGLTVQPDVLASLADTPSFRGRGLLGRFLYSLPENLVGTRLYQNRAVSAAAWRRYEAVVHALLALPPASLKDAAARYPLLLSGPALDLWAEFANDAERRQADDGDLAGIRDWASKLGGAVARIAGGLHLVAHAHDPAPHAPPLSVETIAAAWAIGEYLIPHALAAFGQMGANPDMALARRILKWIERRGFAEFSLRDCHQAHRSVSAPSDLLPALTLLTGRGYLRLKVLPAKQGVGQPKSPVYEVNPLTQNTQN